MKINSGEREALFFFLNWGAFAFNFLNLLLNVFFLDNKVPDWTYLSILNPLVVQRKTCMNSVVLFLFCLWTFFIFWIIRFVKCNFLKVFPFSGDPISVKKKKKIDSDFKSCRLFLHGSFVSFLLLKTTELIFA